MAHGFVYSVFGFGLARFVLGLGESGNFPAAIKATAEWFPKHERAFATGIFNAGSNIGAMVTADRRPVDHADVGLAARRSSSRARSASCGSCSGCCTTTTRPRALASRRRSSRTSRTDRSRRCRARCRGLQLLGYRQTWAFVVGKFLTDGVWWFYTVLAAEIPRRPLRHQARRDRAAADRRLPRGGRRLGRRRMAVGRAHEARLGGPHGAQVHAADRGAADRADDARAALEQPLGRGRDRQRRRGRAPVVVARTCSR